MQWTPATIDEVERFVCADLNACDETQRAMFRRYWIKPYYASIQRYGKTEKVVVVARKSNQVIYFEDVEEGFNVSPVDSDGAVLQHWCNQDTLGEALNYWIAGRAPEGKFSPAENIIKPKGVDEQ